jgi:hypothetical protein
MLGAFCTVQALDVTLEVTDQLVQKYASGLDACTHSKGRTLLAYCWLANLPENPYCKAGTQN